MAASSFVGARIERVEGVSKVTGELQYASDLALPRMLFAKILRSPYAHARIRRIDTSRAKAHAGVVA
ncbi:MAG TPA: hypothetical protein VJM51_06915, partial [Dehalococcoidia bacterium]|nr:hypothetical protein [Dehalococcoidia bacterium]